MVAEELAADFAAAVANEKALREQEDGGFATAAEQAEAEGALPPEVPDYLAGIFLVEWEWDLRRDLGWQGYCQTESLESAKREALGLVTGIPVPSAASRARVVSPTWLEPDLSSPYPGKLRECRKVYAVYERAATVEEQAPLALAA